MKFFCVYLLIHLSCHPSLFQKGSWPSTKAYKTNKIAQVKHEAKEGNVTVMWNPELRLTFDTVLKDLFVGEPEVWLRAFTWPKGKVNLSVLPPCVNVIAVAAESVPNTWVG